MFKNMFKNMFKKYYEYLLVLIISIALTSVLYFYLSQIEINEAAKSKAQIAIENASHRWNDLFYAEYGTEKPNTDVILLAIDEDAVNEVGRWPWSRNIISKISTELFKYKINTLTYDIIFSEKENTKTDTAFAKTISENSAKITLGTYSSFKTAALPYQDFCLTEAFIFTGGLSLVKLNPFFSVDDDSSNYEELMFNQALTPLFQSIDKESEKYYKAKHNVNSLQKLTHYQQNALAFYKIKKVYDYCNTWLTDNDPYDYKLNPELKKIYMEIFVVTSVAELQTKLNTFINYAVRNPIPQYDKWQQNIDVIQDAALYTASFLANPDNDGIVRNYPLIFRTGNRLGTSYIPSPAIQAYLAATGYQVVFKIRKNNDQKYIAAVEIHNVNDENEAPLFTIPTNHEGKLLINYYGKQNMIPYVSAKELLNNSATLEYSIRMPSEEGQFIVEKKTVDKALFLKNKNIIFGATAIGIYDIVSTPTDISYPGPEIHATVLSNLFNGQYITYDKYESQKFPTLFFISILITSLFFIKLEIWTSSILFIALTGVLYIIQKTNFSQGVVFQSSFLYFILLFIAFFTAFIYKYFFQSRKSREIKRAFSKYVSKDVVEEILKNEGAMDLRGKKLYMSVYFSDIRGFTSFSEKMDPVELSELLNKYFTPMSAIITQHRGTIDKYIGDAIMAMFGAPLNYQDHASKACQAALDCIAALPELNREFALKNWPAIKIGIGINTGYMNVGNIGSATIQNYTVIGDSVNLGARLESLTKEYGVSIIISEFTYEIVKDIFNCRELDKVQVKGKKDFITIFELVSLK